MRISLALVLLLASAGLAVADPLDAWILTARDPSKFSMKAAEVVEWRLAGAYGDMTPLSMRLIRESEAEQDARVSWNLAELALIASPEDSYTHYAVMTIALNRKDMGRAIREGQAWISYWFKDPWARSATVTRALLALSLAALSAAMALLISATPYYGPLAGHDLSDRFPKKFKKFAPWGAGFLVFSVILVFGGGVAAFLLVPALLYMFYAPWRVRTGLLLSISLAMVFFSGMENIEKMTGTVGDRGWAFYRVLKGGSGKDLYAELNRIFDARDGRAALARGIVARRNGDYDAARLDFEAAKTGSGVDPKLVGSHIAALEYMTGKPKAALELYTTAAQARGDDWKSWFNVGTMKMALLDVQGSEAAFNKAKSIAGNEVDYYQGVIADTGGNLYPIVESIPSDWVEEAIQQKKVPESGWSSSLWASLGFSYPLLKPISVVVALLLGLALSRAGDRHKLAKRCTSCGEVKCARCHRLVKDPGLCSGCYSLFHESSLDVDSRRAKREDITLWEHKTRTARRWGGVLLPGWNDFVYSGDILHLLLGLLWSSAMGVILSEYVALVPVGTWEGTGLMTTSLLVLAAIYLGCFMRAHNK